MTLITKAPREGASFITSQSELGVIRGGRGGGGPELVGFFRLSPIWSCCQRRLFWARFRVLLGKWLFRRPKEKQASSDAADAGLGVSADAADADRIVATLSGRVG